jgi:hypothetical protein
MARSHFPGMFWLLKRLWKGPPDKSLCCNDLGYLYAFSNVERAYDFQYGRLDSAWTTRLVAQRQLPELVQELEQHGCKGLCFDCAADGSNGKVLGATSSSGWVDE